MYIGTAHGGRGFQKAQNTIDFQPDRVLYIGAPDDPNELNFPTEPLVLYIGAALLFPLSALSPFLIVGFDVIGMLGSISAKITGMLVEPGTHIAIAPLVSIGIVLAPFGVSVVMALLAAGLLRTGFLFIAYARIGPKPASAVGASFLWTHKPHLPSARMEP